MAIKSYIKGMYIMALVKCKECGKEISEDARKCLHCGCPKHTVKMSKKVMMILRVIGIIVLIGFIIACIYYNKSYKDFKERTKQNQTKTYYNF